MPYTDPTTYSHAFIRQTVENTTPTTPVFQSFSRVPGRELEYTSDMLDSQLLRQNRTRGPGKKNNKRGEGGYDLEFALTPFIQWALESAMGATVVGNVLTAGTADVFATIEKKCSATEFQRFKDARCMKWTLTAAAQEAAKLSVDVISAGRIRGTAILTGQTYTPEPAYGLFSGTDITSVTIGATTYPILDIEMTISQDAKPIYLLGSDGLATVNYGAFRDVTIKVNILKESFAVDTVFEGDSTVAVSFSALNGGKGMTFDGPAMQGSIVVDKDEDTKVYSTLELKAVRDATLGSNFKATMVP